MKIFVGLTGASGIKYGATLLKYLDNSSDIKLHTAMTENALENAKVEYNKDFTDISDFYNFIGLKNSIILDNNNRGASVASGSYGTDITIVAPASMGYVARAATGVSTNLIERASDVAMKEGKKLIILFRETPLSVIHLENLTTLAKVGAKIIPASPAFYTKHETVEDLLNFMTGKILDTAGINHNLYNKWGSK